MKKSLSVCFYALMFVVVLMPCTAQDVALGTPPFASLGGGPDVINVGNLNTRLLIPIVNNPGRGLNMTYNLSYDSSIWYPVASGSITSWQPANSYGWQGLTPANIGSITYPMSYSSGTCGQSGQNTWQSWTYGSFVYVDENGTNHTFGGTGGSYVSSNGSPPYCPPSGANPPGVMTSGAGDGSGLTAHYSLYAGSMTIYLVTATGTTLYPPINTAPSTTSETDSNGNEITSNNGAYTDTLGNASVVKVVGQAPETDISYLTPAGTYASYKVTFKQYNIHTYFQCSAINEYTAQNTYLVDKVTLPDSTFYQFNYEETYDPNYPGYYSGRIASVTLPTGGTITYAYTGGNQNHGIECMDGSTAGMTRTLSPGGQWTYARTLVSGTSPGGSKWTTTVTDPAGNNTVFNFAEDASGFYNLYPTQRQVYQGSVSPSNLLLTTVTCYNASFTNCATAAVSSPISQTDTYAVLPNNATRLSELVYNGFGFVSTDNEFDYGVAQGAAPGTSHLIKSTYVGYTSFGKPSQVTVYDVTSGSYVQIASTTYSYDQTAVTGTTGTPQHVSVSGSRGNLTTIAQVASSGTTLYKTFSYYDTGNLNTSTGLSTSFTSPGPTTTYQYGSGSCGNSFVTQSNEPMSLTRSFTWNCTGGVQTQVTDENGQTVKTNYTDSAFWRPANVYDQQSNETLYSYNGETSSSSTMLFNFGSGRFSVSQSVSGILSTVDGFGRLILSQRLQGPGASNYDTTETDYNSVGLANRTTMPFSSAAGGTSSSAPGVNVTYDALGRTTTTTDNSGGTVTYTYTNNDVLQTISGSQNFKKQFEYDGLGRLTSVCEISTTLTGVGTCGQGVTQSGYWTKYTYDALGHLLTVTQNAQAASGSQHRSFSYDQLGRVTSESNPETSNTSSNGTTTYTYDVACTTTPASPGDLTRRVDNAGNNTCYAYDSLHRPTAQGWNTVCRFFAYDNVTPPSGVTVQNTKARLLEAQTTNCGSTQYTDEWFSYSPRGELTDVYEKTPHSGGYYHTTAAYWASGALESLSGIPSVPTIYYGASNGAGLDGEGRYTQVTASSSPNPVTAVTYSTSSTTNPLGALIGVTYGSSDSDSFSYDPNTGRSSTYVFSVNGQADSATLGWNSNGTLGSLAIADNIPGTADSQSCTFSYDDLSRSSGISCGSTGSQSFSYDPFGNISKTANGLGLSFQPTSYNASNQPAVSGMSFTADGNATSDNLGNQYTWDPNWGAVSSVNSVTVTSDAFGRVVEQGSGSTYSEMLWSPVGKVAILSGTTLTKALVVLPGGGTAVYTASGLAYYRHADWLGSSRLASTQARGLYSSSAYAPFGEQYATAGTADASFTGQNSDTVSGLYDFMDRRYSPSQGRWISPDPAGLAAADPTNPQSWNRYAYVLNNPLFYFDPFGDDSDPSICDLTGGWICGNGGYGSGGAGYASLELMDTDFTSTFGNSYQGSNGMWYTLASYDSYEGVTWINNANGEDFGTFGGSEIGLPTSFASFSYSMLLGVSSSGESNSGGIGSGGGGGGAGSPVYYCTSAGALPGGLCPYGCNQMVSSFSAGTVVTQSEEQAACPPARQGCAKSIEVTFTAEFPIQPLPRLKFYKAQIVPNSCIYGLPN